MLSRVTTSLLFIATLVLAQGQKSPRDFWQNVIRKPLTGPDAESLFAKNYKDAMLPPSRSNPPYLEGSVASVEADPKGGQRVLLVMQGSAEVDAAIVFDGREWELKRLPAPGTKVRFSGVIRDFRRDPLLIVFQPERVSGLEVVTNASNTPFSMK